MARDCARSSHLVRPGSPDTAEQTCQHSAAQSEWMAIKRTSFRPNCCNGASHSRAARQPTQHTCPDLPHSRGLTADRCPRPSAARPGLAPPTQPTCHQTEQEVVNVTPSPCAGTSTACMPSHLVPLQIRSQARWVSLKRMHIAKNRLHHHAAQSAIGTLLQQLQGCSTGHHYVMTGQRCIPK